MCKSKMQSPAYMLDKNLLYEKKEMWKKLVKLAVMCITNSNSSPSSKQFFPN